MSFRIMVEWGYELHTLELTDSQWESILSGKPLEIEGDGYAYDGEFFTDIWSFSGGVDGYLVVNYRLDDGEVMDEGVGYQGSLSGALISHHD
ncbi:MAG: hypothetical protein ACQEXG_07705 [Pseudomonadota bacterium]